MNKCILNLLKKNNNLSLINNMREEFINLLSKDGIK